MRIRLLFLSATYTWPLEFIATPIGNQKRAEVPILFALPDEVEPANELTPAKETDRTMLLLASPMKSDVPSPLAAIP